MADDLGAVKPKRGRGRPRTTDAVNPTDILEAAIDAVSHGGYDALSMRGVARSLGVSLATVQHHVGTKAGLYRAVVDYALAEADYQRSLAPTRDLRQRIRNALDASSARPGLLAAFLGDRSAGHEDRLAHVARRFRELFDDPAEIVADLQAGHRGRPVDAEAVLILLTIGITSLAGAPEAVRSIYGVDLADADDRRRLADGLADVLGNGLYEPAGSEAPAVGLEPTTCRLTAGCSAN